MATSADILLATREDFYMATDNRACRRTTPPDPSLRRKTAGCRPLAPAPPCACCIRKG